MMKTVVKYVLLLLPAVVLSVALPITRAVVAEIVSRENNEAPDFSRMEVAVQLTADEKAWLGEHRSLRVAGPRAFPPLHFIDEKGNHRGMASDYLHFVMKQLGMRVVEEGDLPWPEVLKKAREREIDLISCAAKTSDRQGYLAFTNPYVSFPVVIIGRKDLPSISGIKDLEGLSVACVEDGAACEWLKRDRIDFRSFPVNTSLGALQAVSMDRADVVVANLAVADYLIDKVGLTNLKVAAPTGYDDYSLCFAVRNDWPELASIINKVLGGVSSDQHERIRRRWLSIRYDQVVDKTEVMKWVFGIAGIASGILLVFLLWNRRLLKEVEERKRAERALKREHEFRTAIIDHAAEGLCVCRGGTEYPETEFAVWNDRMTEITGYTKDDINRLGWYRTVLPDSEAQARAVERMRRMRQGEDLRGEEWQIVRADGQRRFVSVSTSVLTSNGGDVQVLALMQDVTERKRAEEMRDRVFNLSIDLLSVSGFDGLLKQINPAWTRCLGWTEEELLSKPWLEFVHPDDLQQAARAEERLKEGHAVHFLENRLQCKDGSYRWISWNSFPVSEEKVIFGVARDITKHKSLEQELIRMEKLESIGTLAGGIAHDFSNLLTAIMGNVSLSQMYTEAGDKRFKLLTDAEKACLRAKDLTHQLITFASGGESRKETVQLDRLIPDAVGFSLGGSKVEAHFRIPEDLWPVECDAAKIKQMIHCLITNAREAMPHGGFVEIEAQNERRATHEAPPLKEGTYVHLAIRDQGGGIPQKHLSKVFDPYFSTKERGTQKGMGLGLSIVYSIVKRHEGHISLESHEGAGTTFHIYLPATGEEPQEAVEKDEENVVGAGRVLVMDDEELVRNIVGEMLTYLGYEAVFSRDGAEAVERYAEGKESGNPFDAVVLDLTVPDGMGGVAAVRKLRELDPAVKAIVSSGYVNAPILSKFREYGFKGFVSKPFKVGDLKRVLQKVMTENGR